MIIKILKVEMNLDFVMSMIQKVMEFCGTQELKAMFPNSESLTSRVSEYALYGIMPVKNIFSE